MQKLCAALFLYLGLASAVLAQQAVAIPATMFTIPVIGGVTTGLRLVTGIPGKSIYVTNISLVPAATSVVAFSQGTGAACATGNTLITGAMGFNGNQSFTPGSGYGTVLIVGQGLDLCIIITAAAAPGSLAYAIY
jgi:hypothetical protein